MTVPFMIKRGPLRTYCIPGPHVNCATSKILILGGFRFFILQFTFHFNVSVIACSTSIAHRLCYLHISMNYSAFITSCPIIFNSPYSVYNLMFHVQFIFRETILISCLCDCQIYNYVQYPLSLRFSLLLSLTSENSYQF